jgi:serine/threonine-protein kinase ULK/ATG1
MIKSKSNCYLVYEYCNGGTLLGLLRREQKLEERKALLIFKQLLEAFKVLNKYSIMHRDLTPENIFFTEEGESGTQGVESKRLKLGDFGFCKGLKPDENLAKTMLGSPIYMAPEVLKGESYTTKADIWSLGVILFEMLYGYCPFESRSIASLINTIETQSVQVPANIPVSERTQTLIKRMLAKDYFRRIGWVELFGIKID